MDSRLALHTCIAHKRSLVHNVCVLMKRGIQTKTKRIKSTTGESCRLLDSTGLLSPDLPLWCGFWLFLGSKESRCTTEGSLPGNQRISIIHRIRIKVDE